MPSVRKMKVFSAYLSGSCPGCGETKNLLHWLCIPCAEFTGSETNQTPEFKRLAAACEEHCDAAAAFVDRAKMRPR